MTRHTLLLSVVFFASLAISLSVMTARTAPAPTAPLPVFVQAGDPQPMQSADVHAMIGASFHAVHAGL